MAKPARMARAMTMLRPVCQPQSLGAFRVLSPEAVFIGSTIWDLPWELLLFALSSKSRDLDFTKDTKGSL
jgi:hypothetical protein